MTRTRASLLCFGLVSLLAASGPVLAQSKIGFVNVAVILQNHPLTQQMNESLRSEFAPREAELRGMEEELTAKLARYERDRSVMPESERATLERELQQGDRDFQRRAEELNEDFSLRQNEMLQQLQREVGLQVQNYVATAGYDLVVADAVYVSANLDITQEVFEAITAESGAED